MTHATATVGVQTILTSDFALGTAAAAIEASIFVLLTSSTSATYHLFPLAIAAAAAWLALVLIGEMPLTTLIASQPVGVSGAFVAFGLLGAPDGAWWGSQASCAPLGTGEVAPPLARSETSSALQSLHVWSLYPHR